MQTQDLARLTVLNILFFFLAVTYASFNSDNVLFQLQFPGGSSPGELEKFADNVLTVTTNNNEQYQCVVPPEIDPNAQDIISYDGPSANKIMEPVFTSGSCTLRVETYWTYELCHGMHLRQFHEEKLPGKDTKKQEYFLGRDFAFPRDQEFASQNISKFQGPTKDIKVPTMYMEGKDIPFFEVSMGNGTPCDLKENVPRRTRVKYICERNGRGDIFSLKETSTCEYEVILFSTHLCSHPLYRIKEAPVNTIRCHSMDGSPVQPEAYEALMRRDNVHQYTVPKQTSSAADSNAKTAQSVDRATRGPISSLADDQLLQEFLRGEYCLHGGQGWWRFEFCYGKYAQQYHQDKTGKTLILLGSWDEAAHKKWWTESKKSKNVASKQITHFYSGGDKCDITGKPRQVQVKLKCKESLGQHAVTIYLVEPASCDYILGVEASIICPLLDTADEYGLLHYSEKEEGSTTPP